MAEIGIRMLVMVLNTVAGTCVIHVLETQNWFWVPVLTIHRGIAIYLQVAGLTVWMLVMVLNTVAGTCVIHVVETQNWFCVHVVTIP